jgi:hypothetical protein
VDDKSAYLAKVAAKERLVKRLINDGFTCNTQASALEFGVG